MQRQRALLIFAVLLGLLVAGRWTVLRLGRAPALDCAPPALGLDDAGVLRCFGARPLPAGQALTVGQLLDLNRVGEADLALVPGLGAEVAARLVAARPDGGFSTWAEVDRVEGIGPARMELLQRIAVVRGDGGL